MPWNKKIPLSLVFDTPLKNESRDTCTCTYTYSRLLHIIFVFLIYSLCISQKLLLEVLLLTNWFTLLCFQGLNFNMIRTTLFSNSFWFQFLTKAARFVSWSHMFRLLWCPACGFRFVFSASGMQRERGKHDWLKVRFTARWKTILIFPQKSFEVFPSIFVSFPLWTF